jgi:CRISPR-associated exonuclease Cas4
MVKVTGTLVWYYFVCKREVWLMSREVTPFEEDDLLEIGRLIHEDSYKREKKEVDIFSMRIDVLRKQNGRLLVGEMKKSSAYLLPAKMQLLFYLYKLHKMGIFADGELLVPKECKKEKVILTDDATHKLESAIEDICRIIALETPPPAVKTRFCSKCAYRDFCFA